MSGWHSMNLLAFIVFTGHLKAPTPIRPTPIKPKAKKPTNLLTVPKPQVSNTSMLSHISKQCENVNATLNLCEKP